MNGSLSVVTAVKDRSFEVHQCARVISNSDCHFEHIIIDWGSDPALLVSDFAFDKRIKLYRVETALPWWLSQAYNLGFSLAGGSFILKVDADILVSPHFFETNYSSIAKADFACSRLTYQDRLLDEDLFVTNGLFWVSRKAIYGVSGFNPYIYGWGWDDLDLYSRLFLAGFSAVRLTSNGVSELRHPDSQRVSISSSSAVRAKALGLSDFQIREISIDLNRIIACACIRKEISTHSLDKYRNEYLTNQSVPLPLDTDILELSELKAFLQAEASRHVCFNRGRLGRLVDKVKSPFRRRLIYTFIAEHFIRDRPMDIISC